MNEQMLIELWNQPESERIEWKPSLSQTDSIYRAICAFANDYHNNKQSGVIFIGREDTGKCSNRVIGDKEILAFVGKMRESGSILPFPKISYEQLIIEDCPILALIVEPSHSTPVEYGREAYIRQGTGSRRAFASEITILTQKRSSRTFDGLAVNGAKYEDLDEFYLREQYIPAMVSREVLQENGRTLQDQLSALRVLTSQYHPTALGLLVSGKDTRRFLPGAYVQFLRVDGLEVGDPIIDSAEIFGRIRDVLQHSIDKLKTNIRISHKIDEMGIRIESPDYPFEALRELVVNAIAHRDYEMSNAPTRITWFDDRIEIHNPGGPFGYVTEQTFGQPHVTDYRNPELIVALKHLGFAERFGMGIARVKRLLKDNRNPEIEFEPRKHENYVLATVRKA